MVEFALRSGGGLVDALLGDLDFLRPQRGRLRAARSGMLRFSPRAAQLWRFALGSNAAVIKKIKRGGTRSEKELRAQFDYLFAKSASLFGNAVSHDPRAKGLATEERKQIAEEWSTGWHGTPKNGHTTHLLLSFPSHVPPEKAKLIAEVWAFEMFQSGQHQEDEWAYVAALHTDRAHPHVHIVLNNRGLMKETWFYMAREHAFNLDVMKGRMVEIAAEEGVFLDATSRAERGLLSYGPSLGEIERARAQGRAPEERMREGRALDAALATMARSAEVLRSLEQVAVLTGLPEIGARIAEAEGKLRAGGVVHPFPAAAVPAERADLAEHFGAWLSEAEVKISAMPVPERKALREELYGYAADIARGLGDAHGAQLMLRMPQLAVYGAGIEGDTLTRGRAETCLRPGAGARLRAEIAREAGKLGLNPERMADRLATGATNAWEERSWVQADLLTLAGKQRADLRDPEQRQRIEGALQGFYDGAAQRIDRALEHEAVPKNARLLGSLKAMARIMKADGKVAFRNDDHAERFAQELRQRYGEGIVAQLANGETEALSADIPAADQRQWIARAVVSAAKSHATLGLSLRDAVRAERRLAGGIGHDDAKDWER